MKRLVKVCGMRDTQNINNLIELGVDYMGMIFYNKSPRYIEQLPEVQDYRNIKKVGVFVNADEVEIMNQVNKFDLQAVQLHGIESAELCKRLKNKGLEVFKAFGISDNFDFIKVKPFEGVCDMFIFDTKTTSHGGSGKKFNWIKLEEYKGNTPFLLSGGIASKDLTEVINFEHPQYAGVDLNSGFEIQAALKDINLLKEFIQHYNIK